MLLSFKMFLYEGSIFELVHAQHTTAFLELYFFVFYAAVLTSTSAIHRDGSVLPAHIFIQDEHIDSLKGPFEFNCPEVAGSGIIEYEDTGT